MPTTSTCAISIAAEPVVDGQATVEGQAMDRPATDQQHVRWSAAVPVNRNLVRQVLVAVPARDEADNIGSCVSSIARAARAVPVPVHLVIAADCCSDATVAAALDVRTPGCHVTVLVGTWGGVGAARHAAVAAGMDGVADPSSVWIANTDADTLVPPTWLADQLEFADTFAAIAGVVELDPHEVSGALFERFRQDYRLQGDHHGHVHGANLGVRADAYELAGGWCPRTTVGEDHRLWNRLVESGASVVQTTRVRVATSGRTHSRVEGGFATNLRSLTGAAGGESRLPRDVGQSRSEVA